MSNVQEVWYWSTVAGLGLTLGLVIGLLLGWIAHLLR